jgi:hypothetical protein
VAAVFFGAGIQGPLSDHMSVFGDIRMLVTGEIPLVPLRAGVAWRF